MKVQEGSEFPTEIWINQSELPVLDYSKYWNDEEIEKTKPLYALDGDFSRIDQYLSDKPVVRQFHTCADFLANELKKPIQGSCADLASGNLWAVSFLAGRPDVEKVYCVEYSYHRLLKVGPAILQHYGVSPRKVLLCLGSFYELKLPDKSLDFVLLSEAFHHANRPVELLGEIKRVLKDNGAVIVIGEQPMNLSDRIVYLARFIFARLLPKRVQVWAFGHELFAVRPFSRQVILDPVLGDHGYSLSEYRRLFAQCGFRFYEGEPQEYPLHWFILCPNP